MNNLTKTTRVTVLIFLALPNDTKSKTVVNKFLISKVKNGFGTRSFDAVFN